MGVKITDVAKMAGVSIATVSNVINETRPVRPETKQRVLDAIRELNYIPDSSARHFKVGKQCTIGFIVPDISNIFFASLINAVEEVLNADAYDLIIANTHEDPEKEKERIRGLCGGGADALIIASTFEHYQDLANCIPKDFPYILIDRVPIGSRSDTILTDSRQAVMSGMKQLAQRGHRKVGLIGWKKSLSTTRDRKNAFLRAAQKYGMQTMIVYSDFGQNVSEVAWDMVREGCTALLVINSKLCLELLGLLYSDSHVPEIVAFCDSPEFEQIFSGASLIVQPAREMGRIAGRRLLNRLQNPELRPEEMVLQCTYQNGFVEK